MARTIVGVRIVPLSEYFDDRGSLYEVVHGSDPWLPAFGQLYIVRDPLAGVIRGMHVHKELHDLFHIVSGSALFILVDLRQESPTYQLGMRVICTDRQPSLLVVPPGVAHGWLSLQDETLLVSVGSQEYRRESPDEERFPFNQFDDLFGQNPWMIWPR